MTAHTHNPSISPDDDPATRLAVHALSGTADDRAAAEAFLTAYPEYTDDFVQFEETAAMLPYLVEPAAPAARLRTRLLAQVYADAMRETDDPGAPETGDSPGMATNPAVSPAPVSLSEQRARRRGWLTWAQGAVAAAFLLIAVGLGGWAYRLQGDLHARDEVIARQGREIADAGTAASIAGTPQGAGTQGQLLRLANPQQAVLTISGLPPLAQGKVYQVWFLQGKTPVAAGMFAPNPDGTWSGLVRGDVTNAQGVAISVEPAGGSPAPTGDIVATGML